MALPFRFLLLAAGAAALLAGLHGGMQRIGSIEATSELALWHGPLMVAAFFATLIGLERAVALGVRWLYAAPLLSAASGATLMLGIEPQAGAALAALSALVLAAGAIEAFRQEPQLYMGTLALGIFVLAAANLLWLAAGLAPAVALGWAGFLVLVVAGERLELSRILRHGALSHGWFGLSIAGILTALALMAAAQPLAERLLGASLLLLSAWLFLFDVARRTIRGRGLTRFMAAALIAGYGWLALAGGMLLFAADPMAGFGYDAILHCVFVGFAFSMVFAHASVIFPALTGIELPYRRWLYAPLALLHASLALRLAADLLELQDVRALAGAANAAAILLFAALQAASALMRRTAPSPIAQTGPAQ